jgi:hypothetical protein
MGLRSSQDQHLMTVTCQWGMLAALRHACCVEANQLHCHFACRPGRVSLNKGVDLTLYSETMDIQDRSIQGDHTSVQNRDLDVSHVWPQPMHSTCPAGRAGFCRSSSDERSRKRTCPQTRNRTNCQQSIPGDQDSRVGSLQGDRFGCLQCQPLLANCRASCNVLAVTITTTWLLM